ncbi:MAG TPA: hypothetical protein VKT73_15320 [Xanthobacteraceae bacterium]|nr:hypothetical protein [Xanthobacteraceae bacterium]
MLTATLIVVALLLLFIWRSLEKIAGLLLALAKLAHERAAEQK